MKLNLNKFKKKTVFAAIVAVFLLFVSFLIPAKGNSFLFIFREPLSLLTLIRREAEGVIFYHRNFIQNEKLKKEIDLLKNRLNTLDGIYLENERLKNLLAFKQKSQQKAVAARVIGRSPDAWSSSIIIDKGRRDGIKDGLAVINYLGLIGRVVETQESISKVLLMNDPNLGASALIQRSRQEGLVSGTLGTHLIMKYLPEKADIKIQDTVITSGLNEAYPKGLLIGTVVEINNDFSGLSRYALIKPAVNLAGIEEVLIVIR